MPEKASHLGKKLLLLAVSSLIVIIPPAVGELYCRYFTRINFLDNSSGLFTPRRFGNSYGNTPNFTGISFGKQFRTDEEGLRTSENAAAAGEKPSGKIIVMGDSVVFGPALEADETISGRLQMMIQSRKVLNAGVIGYDTTDYLNATQYYVRRFPDTEAVALFICLNDVNDRSASEIRNSLERDIAGENASKNPVRLVNDFLRSRSKLYLWFKNTITDTQKAYFDYDAAFYARGNDFVSAAMRPVAELDGFLKERNIKFYVYLLPYEYQLRSGGDDNVKLPQKMLTDALRQAGVEVRDLTPAFEAAGTDSKELFLYGDPMHLSPAGAMIAAKSVCADLPGCELN